MELFTMGPKRRRDQDGRDEQVVALEPLELGGSTDADAADPEEVVVGSRHWWGDLVRPDVLAVASAAVLAVTVVGLPFMQFLANLLIMPIHVSTAWTFLPVLLAAAVASLLGLAAVRQAFRRDAATWVRVVGGAATLVALLLLVGTAVTWLYAVESTLVDEFRNFY